MSRAHRAAKTLVAALLTLSCCAASAAARQESVFTPLRLPELSETEAGFNDSALGSLAADALRETAGAELCVVCISELAAPLPQGALSEADVRTVFSEPDAPLMRSELTRSELSALLEALVSPVTADMETERIDPGRSFSPGFPCVSGFLLRYDPTAPAGQRVLTLSPLDEEDGDRLYSVAGSETLFSGAFGGEAIPSEPVGTSVSEALFDWLGENGPGLKGLDWDRVTAIGVHAHDLADRVTRPLLFVCILIPALLLVWLNRRRRT